MRAMAIGIGWLLSAGMAAAQSQSAGPASGPWMVFFDWGKAEIRSDDHALLDRIAAAVRIRPSAHLHLTGHTDRSGTASTNRRAGLRRAELVRAALISRGLSRNAISVASLGEGRPLVPTEDGVREVQNRRVVIAIEE